MRKFARPDGELATSRAAATMKTAMALSSYSTTSLEEVKVQGADNPYMIQMCIVKDRNITLQLLKRAESEIYPHLEFQARTPRNDRSCACVTLTTQ